MPGITTLIICKRCEQHTQKKRSVNVDGKHIPLEKGVYCRHCFQAKLAKYNRSNRF